MSIDKHKGKLDGKQRCLVKRVMLFIVYIHKITPNQHIKMISEGPCETENWSNDSALSHKSTLNKKRLLKKKMMLKMKPNKGVLC